jgi:dethiobiotin synthetase
MTRGQLVVVTGTGTEIGKTHVAEALLLALGRGLRVAGVKPVESGVGEGLTDAERLRRASSFHVKHSGVALKAPISPHLAARQEGVTLDVAALVAGILSACDQADVVLAELPGGLFTPLTDDHLNADFALALEPDFLLLLAPDRLGVLHDTLATVRAAQALGLRIDGVVLIAPAHSDASTGTNASELTRLLRMPVLAVVPRASPAVLAEGPAIGAIARALRAGRP